MIPYNDYWYSIWRKVHPFFGVRSAWWFYFNPLFCASGSMPLQFRRAILFTFTALAFGAIAGPAHAECPEKASEAVAAAKAALAKSDGTAEATACLIAAVEALDQKLDDLIAGKIVFEGPLKAKGGFINQGDEPATKEGR